MVPPVGRRKVLVGWVWVSIVSNGSLGFPAVDVAPVSLTPDAIVPLVIPFMMAVLFRLPRCWVTGLSAVRLRALIVTYCAARHNFPFVLRWARGRQNFTLFVIMYDVRVGVCKGLGSAPLQASGVQ